MDIANATEILKTDTMDKAYGNGCNCPVCGQYVKVYRRSVSSTTVRQLIHAYNQFGTGQYFHVRDAMLDGMSGVADFPKLEHWDLIKRKPHKDGDDGKKSSGYWKITPLGEMFLNDEAHIAKYVLIYNGEMLKFEGDMVNVHQCLTQKFNYNKLMGRLI